MTLFVFVVEPEERELYSPEVPEPEVGGNGLAVLLYLEPGNPGLVGSLRVLGFLDSINTTSCMLGRNAGSAWVQSSPSCMHIAISSGIAEGAIV